MQISDKKNVLLMSMTAHLQKSTCTTTLTFSSVLLQKMLKCRANYDLVIKRQLAGRFAHIEPFRFSSIILHWSYPDFQQKQDGQGECAAGFQVQPLQLCD